MDKANVRILFLALIAIMFIAQAVYDFVKKNRSRDRCLSPTPIRKTTPQQHSPAINTDVTSRPAHLQASDIEYSTTEGIEDDIQSPTECDLHHEELRRAIIWSEILKRKY